MYKLESPCLSVGLYICRQKTVINGWICFSCITSEIGIKLALWMFLSESIYSPDVAFVHFFVLQLFTSEIN